MRFLDAQRKAARASQEENKMMPGSRSDQDGPRTPANAKSPPSGSAENDEPHKTASREVIALADELKLDLSQVKGTGHNGKILVRDVKVAAEVRDAKKLPISGPSHPPEG